MWRDATAVVLCLGQANRMRPLSLSRPKCLLHFCLRPLLAYTLEGLARHNVKRVVLVVTEPVSDWLEFEAWGRERDIQVHVMARGLGLGSAGAVKSAAQELFSSGAVPISELIVIYGDSLLDLDFTGLIQAHRERSTRGGIITVAYHTPVDLVEEGLERTNYGVLQTTTGGRVVRFEEKPHLRNLFSRSASAGVFVIDPDLLQAFPERTPTDLSRDLIAPLTDSGTVGVYGFDISPGYRFDIGTIRAYRGRQLDVVCGRLSLNGVPAAFTPGNPPNFTQCILEGPAMIAASSVIAAGVVLSGANVVGSDVRIGHGSRIRDAILLDGANVGANVDIVGSVVGSSATIGDGVQLAEGSVLGDWSVIRSIAPVEQRMVS